MPTDLPTALAQIKAAASALQAQANAAVLAAQAAIGQAGAQFQQVIAAIEEPEPPPVIDPPPPPTPAKPEDVTGLAVTALDGALLLTWTNPPWVSSATNAGVLILTANAPIDFAPVDKTPFNPGQVIDGVGVVGTVTAGTQYTDTGLTNGTPRYYRLITYDPQGRYSAGVAISGTPVAGATLPPQPPPAPPPATDPNPPPPTPPAPPPTDPRVTVPIPAFLPIPFLPPAPIPSDAPPPTLSLGWRQRWQDNIRAGDPLAKLLLDRARGIPIIRYEDAGDYACAAYAITGDPMYLSLCLERLDDPSQSHTWLVATDNANWWREYLVRSAAMYIVLRDHGVFEARPDLKQKFWDVQNQRCALAYSFYSVLTNDSDQTAGAWAVPLWAKISVPDGNEGARQYLDHPMNDLVHMVIVDYLRRAAGGEWIEGTDYNKETLRVLFRTADLYRYVTGMDEMPELTAWAKKAARAEMSLVRDPAATDDVSYKWGAIEHLGEIWYWLLSQLCLIQNFSGDPYLKNFLNVAFRTHTDVYGFDADRANQAWTNEPWTSDLWWCSFDPSDPGTDYRTAPEFDTSNGFAISDHAGVGLTVFRDGPNSFGGVMCRNTLGVDHYLNAGTIHQLWYKGTPVDTHARGYESMPANAFNGFLWYGHGTGFFAGAVEVCNRLAYQGSADAIYAMHGLGGNAVGDGSAGPPPVFIQEITGSFVLLPGAKGNACTTLVIHDRSNIDAPFDPSLTYDQVRVLMQIQPQEYQSIKDNPRKKRIFRSKSEPVVSADRVTYATDDKTTRIMWFSSSAVVVTVNKDDTDQIWKEEQGYTIEFTFAVDQKWDSATFVQQVWASGEPVPDDPFPLRSTGGEAEGVIVRRVGYPNTAILFNARPGPDLPNPHWGVEHSYRLAYDGKQADRINRNRLHPSGFTLSLPGPCDVLLYDLDPTKSEASDQGTHKLTGVSGQVVVED
jgi:hypothetical protein